MTKMTRRGATVEVAISEALVALNAKREEVEIVVTQQGKRGFLGFGAREAEVVVTVLTVDEPSVIEKEMTNNVRIVETTSNQKDGDPSTEASMFQQREELSDDTAVNETKQYIQDIAFGMGIEDLRVSSESKGKFLTFQLESEKAAMLIGKRGQTLNALQHLAQLIVNKSASQFKMIRIDIGDYRDRRERSLEQLADRMADKAMRSGKKVHLEPMPSYERKVIHNALSNRLDIETYSEGSDPHRYLVIESIK